MNYEIKPEVVEILKKIFFFAMLMICLILLGYTLGYKAGIIHANEFYSACRQASETIQNYSIYVLQ